MTEFEYIEACMLNVEFVRGSAMDLVTVLFAYVICAHLVGAELPRSVAISLSLIYTAFLTNPYAGMMSTALTYYHLVLAGSAAYPESAYFASERVWSMMFAFGGSVPLIGWLASLLYMHGYVRRESARHKNPAALPAEPARRSE